MGNFKKISAFPVYALCFHETFRDKSIGQTENSLERGFVKARLRLNNWPNSFMVIFAGIVALNKLAQLFQVSIYVHPLQQTKGNSFNA